MITLPGSLSKNQSLQFSLNKTQVLAAVSDQYWSDSANISKCIVVYKSSTGNQKKRIEFDFTQASPSASQTWSSKSRDQFEIDEIVLIDFDNDYYGIPKTSLPSGKGVNFGLVVNNSYAVSIVGSSVIVRRGANNFVGWGSNQPGNLGNGSTTTLTTPTIIPYSVNFSAIDGVIQEFANAEGWMPAVGLASSTGYAYGWGNNYFGTIGNGTQTASLVPVRATGDRAYSQISIGFGSSSNSGSYYVLALEKNTGVCYSWGTLDNVTGALGRTTGSNTSPGIATPGITYLKVSANHIPTGVSTSGAIYRWGGGNNSPILIDNSRTYVDVTSSGGTSIPAFFAMGSDGTIYSWQISGGPNTYGLLGSGTTSLITTPTPIAGNRVYSKMAVGENHAAAIETGTNKLYVWGQNTYGQVGDGTTVNKLSPTLIASDKEFSEVVCGANFTVAVEKGTNNIYVWGRGQGHRLGTGSTNNVLTPTLIVLP